MSWHIISYHIIVCYIISYYIILHHIILYYILFYSILLCYIISPPPPQVADRMENELVRARKVGALRSGRGDEREGRVRCDIRTHTPAKESSTNLLLYPSLLRRCSTSCLGHWHGYEYHSPERDEDPWRLRPGSSDSIHSTASHPFPDDRRVHPTSYRLMEDACHRIAASIATRDTLTSCTSF